MQRAWGVCRIEVEKAQAARTAHTEVAGVRGGKPNKNTRHTEQETKRKSRLSPASSSRRAARLTIMSFFWGAGSSERDMFAGCWGTNKRERRQREQAAAPMRRWTSHHIGKDTCAVVGVLYPALPLNQYAAAQGGSEGESTKSLLLRDIYTWFSVLVVSGTTAQVSLGYLVRPSQQCQQREANCYQAWGVLRGLACEASPHPMQAIHRAAGRTPAIRSSQTLRVQKLVCARCG